MDGTQQLDRMASPAPAQAVGRLLAVCGLCGGAGASTLAFLFARHAARTADQPVLLCDTGGPTGGLAAYAGVESPRSFSRLADAIAVHEPLADGLFADGGAGLRVIASGPQLDPDGDADGVARLLDDARKAHRLTVVDCGTLARRAERQVLAAASHVAWVVPAVAAAVERGRRLLEQLPGDGRPELLVARQVAAAPRVQLAGLRALAGQRPATLVLMPDVRDPLESGVEAALDDACVTLDAIETALRC